MTDDELRDSFGEELTHALRDRARPAALVDSAANVEGRVRRVRVRRQLVAAALAAVIAGSGVAAVALHARGTSRVNVATTPQPDAPTTSTLPHSLDSSSGVADWTWVSADHGWALVRTPCGATVCMLLRETTDGGGTWKTVRTPQLLDPYAQIDGGATCAVRLCAFGVRFVTSKVGWLFGPSFVQTTDGGSTWTPISGPNVVDVEASLGVGLRLTTGNWAACAATCTYRVEREALGSGVWRAVSTPVPENPTLFILGSDAYVVSVPATGVGPSELRRSTDRGVTWTAMADPCTVGSGNYTTTSASEAPDGVFVVLCATDSSSVPQFARISGDGGKTFGPRHEVPVNASSPAVVRATSAQTLLVGYSSGSDDAVLVSSDGGGAWRTTLRSTVPAGATVSVGWETTQTARASFGTDAIWTTRDAGLQWTQSSVAP